MSDQSANIRDKGKDKFIQIWRGIAVFIVVYYHFTNRVPASYLGMEQGPTIIYHAGKLGVLIFFVISGYLITKSLRSSTDLAQFYAKRVSRIWPLFILASVVIFIFLLWADPPVVPDGPKKFFANPRSLIDLAGSLFFLEDLGFRWMDGVFWSVLVELKFYFWIGLLAWLRPAKFVSDFALLAIFIAAAEMMLSFSGNPYWTTATKMLNGFFIAQYLPYFAIGALLLTGQNRVLLSVLLVIAVIQAGMKTASNPDFNIQHAAIFGMFLAAAIFSDALLFRSRIFLHIGHYSYAFYLFHQMIGLSIIKTLGGIMSYDVALIIALMTTYGIGMTASWAAEWRFRPLVFAWLQKLFGYLKLDTMRFSTESSLVR